MTPVKGEGSSRHKGKEIATDDPPTRTARKKAPLSESKCFEWEEGSRDPNSGCPPLIDSWYDTHTHFPVIPDD